MKKIAVVTGASKGIGRACALRLAKDGMLVIVNYSSSDAAAEALDMPGDGTGNTAMDFTEFVMQQL